MSAESDPIGAPDEWASWSHEQIRAVVDGIDPARLAEAAGAWVGIGERIQRITREHGRRLQADLADMWGGPAGEQARAALAPVREWGDDFGGAVRRIGETLERLVDTAERTRAQVPPVPDGSLPGGLVALTTPGSGAVHAYELELRRADAELTAQQVMYRVYSPGVDAAADALPRFVAPPNPTAQGQG